jgi:hypothetical protein
MTLDEMKSLIRQASDLGARIVVFTGGEPSLLKDKLITLLRFIKAETRIGLTRIVTNGKWATTYQRAHETLKSWKDAGLDEINISCGEYHQEFVPIESVAHAYKAACELNFMTVLLAGEFLKDGCGKFKPADFERAIGERLLSPPLASPYIPEYRGLSCGAAMNYGRGKDFLKVEELMFQKEEQMQSCCSEVFNAITVHPNGNTTACCGIMVREESLLNIGNWREKTLKEIVEAAHQDVTLNWIRYLGLKNMKTWLKEKDPSLQFRDEYINICDLCAEIVYNKRCQELLNQHGAERTPDIVANRVAMEATVYEPGRFTYAEYRNEGPAE